jgi:hypothetical protein
MFGNFPFGQAINAASGAVTKALHGWGLLVPARPLLSFYSFTTWCRWSDSFISLGPVKKSMLAQAPASFTAAR